MTIEVLYLIAYIIFLIIGLIIDDNSFKINYVNNSVNVVNYDKILEVTDEVIRIIKDNKIILINGNDLRLSKLLDNEILITGLIHKIEL